MAAAGGEARPGRVKIRRALERCLQRSPHDPLLWRHYLRFEARHGAPDEQRKVFYRAISRCPWSKPLWMEGLSLLGPRLTGRERADLIELAGSRGIVFDVDVYEVLLEDALLIPSGGRA